MSRPTLVIPVVFPDPDVYPVAEEHLDGLNRFDIVLSGYWELPDHLTPAEARAAHETEAEAILYDIAATFSHAGASTDIRLQFGPGGAAERAHQNRVVEETAADGILLADRLSSLLNVLVPLRDTRHLEGIVEFVSQLNADSLFVVELYHAAADQEAAEPAAEMLQSVAETLLARGFSEADIERTVERAADASAAIAARARGHHLVVMGESEEPDAEDRLFGPVSTDIAEESETPVIVVHE